MADSEDNEKNREIGYELFKDLSQNKMIYVYRGTFTQTIIDNLLNLAEVGFMQNADKKAIRRKIYHVMVEGLQNIIKHQVNIINVSNRVKGVFILNRKHDKYLLTTCNMIENVNTENLTNQIEYINRLSKDELRAYYRKVLDGGTISEKGGAGLGLIDMCLKSGSKLFYSFEKYDNTYSLFYFHSEISSLKDYDNRGIDNLNKLAAEKQLHQKLMRNNILLILNSYFSQESLINLLSVIDRQMDSMPSIKKRICSIMVEMIQNVIKHSDDYESTEDGKAGMFYISEKDDVYTLHSGNYISKEKLARLSDSIKNVNDLNNNELEKEYSIKLSKTNIENAGQFGLGIINIRIQSQSKIELDIFDVNADLSFCVLHTDIQKLKHEYPIIS